MLQFDRIKIRTSIKNFSIPIQNHFMNVMNNEGEIIYTTYSSKVPSLLTMRIDHQRETVMLDFTGKILLDQYPELLSINTIQSAIREIAIRTGCTVNEHAILDDAEVLLADVTKDISLSMTPDVKQELFMSCSNVKKWRTEIHKENGIEIRKAVKNKSKCRERLSLYCKATEMLRSENKMFLLSLNNEGSITEYFQRKTRVECNLTSAYMIKRMLEIESTSLREVLESKANPLLKTFRKVFDLDTTSKTVSTTEFRVFRKRTDHYMRSRAQRMQ